MLEYVNDDGVTVKEEVKPKRVTMVASVMRCTERRAPNYVKRNLVLTNTEILDVPSNDGICDDNHG